MAAILPPPVASALPPRITRAPPAAGSPARGTLTQLIQRANHRLMMSVGEAIPPELPSLLLAAQRRGVDVHLLVQADGGLDAETRGIHRQLEQAGVDVVVRRTAPVAPGTCVSDGLVLEWSDGPVTGSPHALRRAFDGFAAALARPHRVQSPALLAPGKVRLHTMPESGRGPILNAIDSARSSLDVSVYVLSEPSVIAALERAARRGVRVRVMLEAETLQWSNFSALTERLRSAGVNVKATPPRFSAGNAVSHAKFLIADDRALLFGTGNLSRGALGGNDSPTSNNRELWVEDARRGAVQEARALFDADWERRQLGRGSFRYLVVTPENAEAKLLGLVDGAKRRLYVYNQFLTDDGMVDALLRAKARGVDVRVLLSRQRPSDNRNDQALQRLRSRGVAAGYFTRHYLHAKAIVADDVAFIGSQNFTDGGLGQNRELGEIFTKDGVVDELAALFLADQASPSAPSASRARRSADRDEFIH